MTIVPIEKLKHDPQKILYQFPSMHPVRYQKLSREYTFWKLVETAEKVAKMTGKLLVPSSCMNQERKRKYNDRCVEVRKHRFYVLSEEEMTKTEIRKFRELL